MSSSREDWPSLEWEETIYEDFSKNLRYKRVDHSLKHKVLNSKKKKGKPPCSAERGSKAKEG